MLYIPGLDNVQIEFPDVDVALDEPNGLLAIGGDLQPRTLLAAYRQGIFPWFGDGEPIMWWSPDPRAVIVPPHVNIRPSLAKRLRQQRFELRIDTAFDDVILACAQPRPKQPSTWITANMSMAYRRLHRLGYAHSVEAWHQDQLVGGLYGLAIGKVFFGESMFSRESDASKVALVHLAHMGFELIDCQVESEHISSMGAVPIPRRDFVALLPRLCDEVGPLTQNALP